MLVSTRKIDFGIFPCPGPRFAYCFGIGFGVEIASSDALYRRRKRDAEKYADDAASSSNKEMPPRSIMVARSCTNRPQTAAQIICPTEDNKKRNSAPRLRTPLLDRLSQLLGEAPPHSQQLFLRILSLLLAPLNPSSQLLHLVPQLFP